MCFKNTLFLTNCNFGLFEQHLVCPIISFSEGESGWMKTIGLICQPAICLERERGLDGRRSPGVGWTWAGEWRCANNTFSLTFDPLVSPYEATKDLLDEEHWSHRSTLPWIWREGSPGVGWVAQGSVSAKNTCSLMTITPQPG